jgi:hypothetical protein
MPGPVLLGGNLEMVSHSPAWLLCIQEEQAGSK